MKASANPELSNIWTPDLEMYNQDLSIAQSFHSKDAIVFPDGSVFWSRVGNLQPLCAFSGLKRHPFDVLECAVDLGGWTRSGLFANYTFADPPLSFDGKGRTTYQEYKLLSDKVRTKLVTNFYPCCPDEPWPVLSYTFVFKRTTSDFYLRTLVIPIILLTYLAASVFWFDVRCGERLAMGITILLAIVATQIVAAERLPKCAENLWIEMVCGYSKAFSCACLVESCIVTHIFYRQRKEKFEEYISNNSKHLTGNKENNNKNNKFYRTMALMMMKQDTPKRSNTAPSAAVAMAAAAAAATASEVGKKSDNMLLPLSPPPFYHQEEEQQRSRSIIPPTSPDRANTAFWGRVFAADSKSNNKTNHHQQQEQFEAVDEFQEEDNYLLDRRSNFGRSQNSDFYMSCHSDDEYDAEAGLVEKSSPQKALDDRSLCSTSSSGDNSDTKKKNFTNSNFLIDHRDDDDKRHHHRQQQHQQPRNEQEGLLYDYFSSSFGNSKNNNRSVHFQRKDDVNNSSVGGLRQRKPSLLNQVILPQVFASKIKRKIKQRKWYDKHGLDMKNMDLVKQIDLISFRIFVVTYTSFLLFGYCTVSTSLWDDPYSEENG